MEFDSAPAPRRAARGRSALRAVRPAVLALVRRRRRWQACGSPAARSAAGTAFDPGRRARVLTVVAAARPGVRHRDAACAGAAGQRRRRHDGARSALIVLRRSHAARSTPGAPIAGVSAVVGRARRSRSRSAHSLAAPRRIERVARPRPARCADESVARVPDVAGCGTPRRARRRAPADAAPALPRQPTRSRLRAASATCVLDSRPMIDREQVLHVARLARLELTDDEVERMARRALRGPRPHREDLRARPRRRAADAHVVEVANALRADEPRPSLPREVALAQAPADAGRRLPRPEPAGRHERRSSTSTAAAGRRRASRAGELDAAELFEAYRERARGRRAQRLHLGRRRGAAEPRATRRARSRGVPLAVKDLFCTEGVPSQAGSRILEGYRPPYTRDRRRAPRRRPARRCSARRTRTSSRWARRTRTPASARSCNPWDREPRPGRLLAAAAPPPSPPASRRGRSAPTPAARSASPPRCAASSGSSRPTARSRATG